jgi:hypothetical protein
MVDRTQTATLEPDAAASEPAATSTPEPAETPDLGAAQVDPGDRFAGQLQARFRRQTPTTEAALPRPQDEKAYKALPFGSKYIDPTGDVQTKYYKPKTALDYRNVPEGAEYLDPQGKRRTKAKTEGLNASTQILFNMAVNDAERKNALEHGYPGKVKKDQSGDWVVVEDDGTRRKPKGITEAPISAAAGMAAPTALAAIGAVGGTAMGGFAGTAIGGASGAMLGQSFNDIVLGLTGVYDRTKMEQLAETGLAGLSAATGVGVGKGFATIAPAAMAATGFGKTAAPTMLASVFGATKEGVGQALALREKGVLVPPSGWAPEAPHLINIVEVFDPAFRTQQPLRQSAIKHYEDTARKILQDAGVEEPESVTKPTRAVPVRTLGLEMKEQAAENLRRLDTEINARTAALKGEVQERASRMITADEQSLERTANEAKQAADTLVQQGFKDIQGTVDQAMKVAGAGHNSGDLWWAVGEKFKALRQGIMSRANIMYNQADALAGGRLPDVTGLPDIARQFLKSLPETFENRFPSVVKQLRDIGGIPDIDPKNGNQIGWLQPPVNPTFGQLHNLRSFMRSNYNALDLTLDAREGVFKFFANRVDGILNDINAVPELKAAAQALRRADNFYRENMAPLTANNIQAVMNGLRANLPADPKALFDVLVKEGRSDQIAWLKDKIGPNLWAAVKAADIQEMLDMSKSLVPDIIDGRAFARQVLDRDRRGLLKTVHGRDTSEALLQQARNAAMVEGDVRIPIHNGDTLADLVERTRLATEAAKAAAKSDPLNVLQQEMTVIDAEAKQLRQQAGRALERDPLGILYNPTIGASEAAKRVLDSDDLIIAVADRFGRDSPMFKMVQQTYLERLLRQTRKPGERLAAISPEIQQLVFPGATLEQLQTLAKEMDFLIGRPMRETGKSIAAQSRVEHPWGSIPLGKTFGKVVPGADWVGRQMLGGYYKFVTTIMNKPGLMRFVQKGLEGDEASRLRIRELLQKYTQAGGVVGAGVGEAAFQIPRQHKPKRNKAPTTPEPTTPEPTTVRNYDAQGNLVK